MGEFMQFWIAHDIVSLIGGGITFGVIILIGVAQYLLEKRKKKRRKKDERHDL